MVDGSIWAFAMAMPKRASTRMYLPTPRRPIVDGGSTTNRAWIGGKDARRDDKCEIGAGVYPRRTAGRHSDQRPSRLDVAASALQSQRQSPPRPMQEQSAADRVGP